MPIAAGRWYGAVKAPARRLTARRDVRSFERAIRGAWLRPARGARLMLSAISESVIVRDKLGNPCIERARRRGRIDPLSAAVIATGLAERIRARPATRYRSFVIGDAA